MLIVRARKYHQGSLDSLGRLPAACQRRLHQRNKLDQISSSSRIPWMALQNARETSRPSSVKARDLTGCAWLCHVDPYCSYVVPAHPVCVWKISEVGSVSRCMCSMYNIIQHTQRYQRTEVGNSPWYYWHINGQLFWTRLCRAWWGWRDFRQTDARWIGFCAIPFRIFSGISKHFGANRTSAVPDINPLLRGLPTNQNFSHTWWGVHMQRYAHIKMVGFDCATVARLFTHVPYTASPSAMLCNKLFWTRSREISRWCCSFCGWGLLVAQDGNDRAVAWFCLHWPLTTPGCDVVRQNMYQPVSACSAR